MKILTELGDPLLARGLKSGAVAVLRTDTIYGLAASALNEAAVENLYTLKRRDSSKACIVLIGDVSQLLPGTYPSVAHKTLMGHYWPGAFSLVLPISTEVPLCVSRGKATLAYRLPLSEELRSLLRKTGPLLVPSANPEGLTPAKNIEEAIAYFGDTVDLYVDSGTVINATASQIIEIDNLGRESSLR